MEKRKRKSHEIFSNEMKVLARVWGKVTGLFIGFEVGDMIIVERLENSLSES
jgi:translation initiation factor IF-1